MLKKDIDSLAVGDVVAQPVYDDKGNVLVHAGAEITSALVRVLKRRGVDEVEIKDDEDIVEDAQEHASESQRLMNPVIRQKLDDMQEHLNIGFQHHEGNVTMAMLYKTVLDYLTLKIMNGER